MIATKYGCGAVLGVALALPAQQADAESAPATKERVAVINPQTVRSTLEFLAADDMAGRDSPSPGLERAADALAQKFEAFGLLPGGADKTYFHHYQLDGYSLALADTEVVVHPADGQPVSLKAGTDYRLQRVTGPFHADRVAPMIIEGDTRLLNRRVRGQRPALFAADPSSSMWRGSAVETMRFLRRGIRRRGGPPWLLLRREVVPDGDFTVTVDVPEPSATKVELRNVVAILRAPESSPLRDEFVLFSAHYDHVGIGAPVAGDAIYNGADDDATGTTAVIALAEAFAKRMAEQPLKRSLAFVCFSAEEKGLRGSAAFAAKPPEGIPLESIAVNINIEMLGRPPKNGRNQAWVTGASRSNFAAGAKAALARAGIETIEFPMAERLFFASDNASFARRGVVAHSISAGELHSDYHRPGDEFDKIDLDHMTAVIEGLFEVGVDFANAAKRPAYNENGRPKVRRRR